MKNIIISALAAHTISQMDFWINSEQAGVWIFIGLLMAIQCFDWKLQEWREGSDKKSENQ